MKLPEDVEHIFLKSYSPLDEDAVLRLNQLKPGELNNVVVGLQKECFGLMCMDDAEEIIYQLFYVNGMDDLQGDILELSIDSPHRDQLLFYFSQFLEHNYRGLSAIDTFNTFQRQTRTFLENIGYLTVSPTEFSKHGEARSLFFAKGVKGIINVPYINKKQFYKSFFGNKDINRLNPNDEVVYLMLNPQTNLVKIGKSKNPSYREKTLQGQEPEVMLVSFWKAPGEVERRLHKEFSGKRQRGEWFDLTFMDLKRIRDLMNVYE